MSIEMYTYVYYNKTYDKDCSLKEREDKIMAEIKILKHSVVIIGQSFEDCKSEWDRIVNGVKKDFSVECNLKNCIFSNMTELDGECIAVFSI